MALVLTKAASVEPISLTEAKAHLRVSIDNDDTEITTLITVVRRDVEKYLHRALITQAWTYTMDAFPGIGRAITVPLPPLISVVSLQYIDQNGETQTMTANTEYTGDILNQPGRIVAAYGTTWPTIRAVINAVTLKITCGYGEAAADVPEEIRQAMLLLIGHLYAHREITVTGMAVNNIPWSVEMLLSAYRILRA